MVGFDYVETLSPIMKFGIVRIILIIYIPLKWSLKQIDVNKEFLNGIITDEVYMHNVASVFDKEHPIYVCKLQKSLYGLRQEPCD